MNPLDLLEKPETQALHTFEARYEAGECFFRAHYRGRNRSGGTVARYIELRASGDMSCPVWTYRSGYQYHDNQFWSVPAEQLPLCEAFARHVVVQALTALAKERATIESAAFRAGVSIAGDY